MLVKKIAQKTLLIITIYLCFFVICPKVYATDMKNELVSKTVNEWLGFNQTPATIISEKGRKQLEFSKLEIKQCKIINQHWLAVPKDAYGYGVDTCKFPEKPKPGEKGWDDYPWSAAFISYAMKISNVGNKFKYSSRHSDYIIEYVKNPTSYFKGLPITNTIPESGDLLCAPRDGDKKLTYDEIFERTKFASHCDIIVDKYNNDYIEVIGGNVGDSITKTIVLLDSNGKVKVTDPEFRPWLVVIKNLLS